MVEYSNLMDFLPLGTRNAWNKALADDLPFRI